MKKYLFFVTIALFWFIYSSENNIIKISPKYTIAEKNFNRKYDKKRNIEYSHYITKYTKRYKKQLIITTGYGYSYEQIDIFFSSLNHTSFEGEKLILIHEKVDCNTLEYLKKENVRYILLIEEWPYFSIKNEYYYISQDIINQFVPKYKIRGKHKIPTLRYFIILAFLVEYKKKYDIILILDSRDAYFQMNPFSWNIKNGVSLFEESRGKRIYEQPTNNRWVQNLNYSYEKVKNNFIINGGAIYFSPSDGIKFLKRYIEFFKIVKDRDPNDQSMINVLVYDHYFSGKINIYKNTNTPIRNLVLELMTSNKRRKDLLREMYLSENNLIYNEDGSIPVVIHQYDRIKDLVEICKLKYSK